MKIGVDYIGVSAGAVVKDGDGKFFLAKRGQGARDDVGTWEFPGGTIEFGESREEAAKRNLLDKYGIEFQVLHVIGVYDVIDAESGDHWISTTYLGDFTDGEPAISYPDKCDEMGWFTYEEVGTLNLSRISQRNYADLHRFI